MSHTGEKSEESGSSTLCAKNSLHTGQTGSPKNAGGGMQRYSNAIIAKEVSRITRYCDLLLQWRRRPEDTGMLFEEIECDHKSLACDKEDLAKAYASSASHVAVLLNGNINHDTDIQETFVTLKEEMPRTARILLVAYNPYFRVLYQLANFFGFRKGEQPSTFVTHTDLKNLGELSGFEMVRSRPAVYLPWNLGFVSDTINAFLPAVPLLRWLGLVSVIVLRPVVREHRPPSLSIVIPARNEKGNIENALKRMPSFHGASIEVIFVEGHSSDGTWEEIQRIQQAYQDRFDITIIQQTGKGKSDAVRLGFGKAKHELLTILDADLTMPPELLERYYEAYCEGLADFVNGNRLVYPMEGEAMRFLNHLGNIFFAKALSMTLDTPIGDSLCGSKLLSSRDHKRFTEWRRDFGDVDPFGDFELLFPAAELGLGVIDIPIKYRDRRYGTTNISRWSHGLQLARMTAIGFFRIRMGNFGPR